MARVALYVRVSTEEQKIRGLSVDAQLESLTKWAAQNEHAIIGIFNDAGISARKKHTKRPELLRLLDEVKAGSVELIVFTKLDRWFRNISEYYKVQEILEASNVNWKTIHEDYDTSTASGRLKINIMLSVAQDEADRDSERIKAVFDSKRARGEVVTGSVPTGYIISNKKMIKDPEKSEMVQIFFDSFLETRSIAAARNATLEKTGQEVSYQLAMLLLGKSAYYGTFNGVDGICPAYITVEQFGDIQNSRKRTERKTVEDRVYLFTGIVFCGSCGNRFRGNTSRYKRKDGGVNEAPLYCCPGNHVRGNCDNKTCIREYKIENYLLSNVESDFNELAISATGGRNIEQHQKDKAELLRLNSRLEKSKELFLNGLIDLAEYRKKHSEHEDAILAIEKRRPAFVDTGRLSNIFSANWKESYLTMSKSNKQAFWRRIIDKIIISNNRDIAVVFRQ